MPLAVVLVMLVTRKEMVNVTAIHVESFRRRLAVVSEERPELSSARKATIAVWCGLAGGLGAIVPIVIYDWANVGHSALEVLMAPTAWLFGLNHFVQNGYDWWAIVIGLVLFAVYWVLHGVVFGGLADRFLQLRTLPETLGAGLAWGFVSWLFFWYTLLPIARGGAPFHATVVSSLFVAPTWVFIVGFMILGLGTSLCYVLLRRA
jgi:hypothetical protein